MKLKEIIFRKTKMMNGERGERTRLLILCGSGLLLLLLGWLHLGDRCTFNKTTIRQAGHNERDEMISLFCKGSRTD